MTNRSRTLVRLASTTAVVASLVTLAGAPAQAATTTIKATGATITRSDATAGTTLTVKATVARLDLWCTSNKLVVNKKATAIPCNKLLSVTTTGLTGNDTVEINATGFGSSLAKTTLIVKTGAGNDTINVRHRGSLTVYAGAGNDKVGAGLASGTHPVAEQLLGEDGNDTLTNYGFITATPVLYDWNAITPSKAVGSTLRGGPGADTIVGDNFRWSDVAVASNDKVDLKEGPALVAPDEGAGVAPSWTYQVAAGSPWNEDTLQYGRATALAVRCVPTTPGRANYTVNGLRIPVPCGYHYLTVQGTNRAETLDYDQKLGSGPDRYGLSINASMAGGDDVAAVRAPGGSSDVEGGDGNDRLTIGIHGFGGESGVSAGASGGNGNDTLTNLGFVDPNPPGYDPDEPSPDAYPFSGFLTGGPGADRLVGAATTITTFVTDLDDTIVDGGGPGQVRLATTAGDDTIAVNHGSGGSSVDVTAPTGTKHLALSPLIRNVEIDALAGNDRLSVVGRSAHTWVTVHAGAGSDDLAIRPLPGYSTFQQDAYAYVTQPGGAGMSYEVTTVEHVAITALT